MAKCSDIRTRVAERDKTRILSPIHFYLNFSVFEFVEEKGMNMPDLLHPVYIS